MSTYNNINVTIIPILPDNKHRTKELLKSVGDCFVCIYAIGTDKLKKISTKLFNARMMANVPKWSGSNNLASIN